MKHISLLLISLNLILFVSCKEHKVLKRDDLLSTEAKKSSVDTIFKIDTTKTTALSNNNIDTLSIKTNNSINTLEKKKNDTIKKQNYLIKQKEKDKKDINQILKPKLAGLKTRREQDSVYKIRRDSTLFSRKYDTIYTEGNYLTVYNYELKVIYEGKTYYKRNVGDRYYPSRTNYLFFDLPKETRPLIFRDTINGDVYDIKTGTNIYNKYK